MSDRQNMWRDSENMWRDSEGLGEQRETHRVIQGQVWHRTDHPLTLAGIPHQRDNRARAYDSEGAGAGEPGGTRRSRRPLRTRRSRARRIMRAVILLLCLLVVTSVSTYVWADTRLNREVDLAETTDRVPPGRGTNYLIVGSDSRAGLSGEAIKDLHTGGSAADGRRTDSMILLHTGAHGTTMMSLPRDSWVTIPSYIRPDTGRHYRPAKNKLNAAFSFGGPELLIRTIELNTGLHIDHYAEIGFAGFVGIVNAVGGVPMCVDRDIKDQKSGLDLKKGCHTLDGRDALAFVRQRHQEAQGDLGRSRNQQKFLAALAHQAATPGIALNPAKLYPAMSSGLDTLIVDKGMSLRTLTSLFQAMRSVTAGHGKQINVPVSSLGFRTSKGSAVKWDEAQAKKLFAELRNDRPVTFTEKK
ncbi:LCP family protein [Streptomyces dysideae]|uniref:LCP family protein n=1 Tax=Streptomyces dysideae TaxID=909626 RepID=UPI00099E33B6|nr:LCP family protein [Streptomyces dysideae]